MLTAKAKQAIKESEAMKGRIAEALNRSMYSVNRWLDENSVMLTTAVVMDIIREETGLSDEDILEPATSSNS